jgi:type IV secretion system protein TrbI
MSGGTNDPDKEGLQPDTARPADTHEDDARPLTGEPVAPMRLRPEPPRVTRLSRKVLIGLGAASSLAISGALYYALQTRNGGGQGQELYSTDNRSTPDGLNGLPKDYSGVPKLGPPLPGDLGRPILNAQNAGQPVPTPGIVTPNTGPVGPTPEEQRRAQELEAARLAKLFAPTETRAATSGTAASPNATVTPTTDLASLGLAPQPATPSAQQRQQAFLDAAPDKRTVAPDRVAAPASANVLQAGAVISAALITGVRSDLPGQITAQVTENIYDSPTGKILLIPQGTRVVGQYDNGVGFGQKRILLVWNRLIFPNGRSIVLERQPGADAEGYAGLQDGVDYHWGELFKAAALSTLLSIGSQMGTSGDESEIARALRQGASDSVSQVGRQVVGRQLDIAPTLTIRPGFPVRVIVTRDLVLEPYGSAP